ncbi:GlcNAc-PI de-N-acetylase [Actinoplanes cyaneus]|nr:GlcNAc-PI de-N-acetylase [Actinoplanes cyaneus]
MRLFRPNLTRIAATVLALTPATVPDPAMTTPVACVSTMTVVAHEDDDLLFVNPEISDDISAGRCVTTLYVTSGDAARGPAYWRGREEGEMAAYARMAARPSRWTEDTLTADGHTVHRATLDGAPITLLFLRLPDRVGGWPDRTLQLLWLDPSTQVRPLDDGPAYTRAGLLGVLGSLLTIQQPRVIRTLDFRGAYGDGDHDDHHTAAYFLWDAQRRYRTPHRTIGHLGYPVDRQPANLTAAQYETKLGYFLTYAPHDPVVCQTVDWCTRGTYGAYLRRNVTVGPPTGPGRNVAAQARVTASSGNAATVQVPAKAVDGRLGADLIGEWVTAGETAGAWLDLRWPAPQRLDRIVLHDRPDPANRITAGVLRFSDGSRITVGPLPDDGAPLLLTFAPRTVTGLRFTITAVSATTTDAGLAEIHTITAAPAARRP